MSQAFPAGLAQRPAVRQFIKFCVIGLSSTIIDLVISSFLIYRFNFPGWNNNPTLSKSISFLFGVTNGFFWNSRWTFQGMGSGKRHEMYVKFVMVNIVGFCLNIFLFKSVLFLFTGIFIGQKKPDGLHFLIATLVATAFVAFWNFCANKLWTFKAPSPGISLEKQLENA